MSKKEQLANNIFKVIFLILFLAFLTIYFSQESGYYDYELHKQSVFTKEQIKKFEEDVANGKDVRIEDYLVSVKKDYSNKTSKFGYFVSKNVGKYIKDSIENTFKIIGKFVE